MSETNKSSGPSGARNQGIDIHELIAIARAAGDAIMMVYAGDFAVNYKDDHSPLTEADKRSNDIVISGILRLYPDANIISEESESLPYERRKDWRSLWLIDPLDGTKEFVKRNGEFTVNIALIEDGVPTIGVVYAPVPDLLYYGISGDGSYKVEKGLTIKIHAGIPYMQKDTVKILTSRSHMSPDTQEFVRQIESGGKKVEFHSVGSSLKTCLVAEGAADVYPRFGPTMEWDTAAAHAIALNAGADILNAHTGLRLNYNKPDLTNPSFIAS